MTMSIEAHGAQIRLRERPGVIRSCWKRGVPYESPLLEHIYRQGFKGTAVDAGANIGNHALWLSMVCGLTVHAFEPIHHEELIQNVRLNGAEVQVHACALGERMGMAEHVGNGKLRPGDGFFRVRALDGFRLENVAVIKADVEDMEPEVFRGGEQTIRRDKPVIYAESRSPAAHAATAAVLEPWGYRMTKRFDQRGRDGTWTPMQEWRA